MGGEYRKQLVGVGIQDAGKKVWFAEGVVNADSLLIEACFRAKNLQDSGNDLNICLPALKDSLKHAGPKFVADFEEIIDSEESEISVDMLLNCTVY